MPFTAGLHQFLGNILRRLGNSEAALSHYDKAIAADPATAGPRLHFSKGDLLFAEERFDEAAEVLKRATELDADYAQAHLLLGRAFHKLGKLEDAESSLRKAVELAPEQAEAWAALGAALLPLEKHSEALRAASKAVELNSRLPAAHCAHAGALLRTGNIAEAEKAARHAVDLSDTDFPEGLAVLAAVNVAQGRYTEAEQCLKRAVNANFNYAEGHANLAVLYSMTGKLPEARQAMKRALSLKPNSAAMHIINGKMLMQSNNEGTAIKAFDLALRLDPKNASALVTLCHFLITKSKIDLAGKIACHGVEHVPDNARLWFYHGVTLRIAGKQEEARRAYEEALLRDPEFVDAQLNLGLLLLQEKKVADAITALQKTVELAPERSGAWKALAKAYSITGDKDQSENAESRARELKEQEALAQRDKQEQAGGDIDIIEL